MRIIIASIVLLLMSIPASGSEPAGIKLRWDGGVGQNAGTERKFLLPWGASKADLMVRLTGKETPSIEEIGAPTCFDSPVVNEEECSLGVSPYSGWFADMGEEAFNVTLCFHDGKFFQYFVTFPEGSYTDVKKGLLASLGKPKSAVRSSVSNRMGASFGQEVVKWNTKSTSVEVEHYAGTIENGDLTITYKPIANKSSRRLRQTTKAPF